jgi:hypothetical protein
VNRAACRVKIAHTHNERAGLRLRCRQKSWQISGEVLAIGVHRNRMGKAKFRRPLETGAQRRTLAAVALQADYGAS